MILAVWLLVSTIGFNEFYVESEHKNLKSCKIEMNRMKQKFPKQKFNCFKKDTL